VKHLGILTNGILLEEFLEKLEPYLIDNTVSPVISLDSLKSDVHNYARNSGLAWDKSIKSLKALSLLKSKYQQINFNVITMITSQNLTELVDIASFIKSLGANSLQFQALLPNNLNMAERKKSVFWISEENLPVLDRSIDSLVLFKKENPGFIKNSGQNLLLIKKYFRGKLTSRDVQCLSAAKTILVSNQGKCSTCFSAYGDIRIMELEEILRSKDIITAREKVKNCFWPCLLPCFCDL
jgi:MoaA/NifB/PqqE/SkfB family radical SAM enzyme